MLRLRFFFLNETYKIAEEIYRRRTIKSVFHKCYRKHFNFFRKKQYYIHFNQLKKGCQLSFQIVEIFLIISISTYNIV